MSAGIALSWVVAVGVSIALGYFITFLLWPTALNRFLMGAFVLPVGLGFCSLIFFVFRRPMFTVETGCLLVMAGVAVYWRKAIFRRPAFSTAWKLSVPVFVLAVAVGWGLSGMMQRIDRMPHGDGDAWAIWNSHSRHLYRDGASWKVNIRNTFHPDYPLLTPALTARLWRYAGREIPDAGGMLGVLFALSGLAILFGILLELKDLLVATVFGLVLITTPFYLEHSVSQSADVPLAVYFLSTVALISLHFSRTPRQPGLLVLAGFCAGLAAWTKNEGMVLIVASLLVLTVALVFSTKEGVRGLGAFLCGLIVPVGVILFFKFTIAPAGDIFGDRHYAEFVSKIFDPSRYATILEAVVKTIWSFGGWMVHPVIPLLALIGSSGIHRGVFRTAAWWTGGLILLLIFAGYLAIYTITPMELQWHLDSSLPRLLLHLWPAFLFVIAMATRLTPAKARA